MSSHLLKSFQLNNRVLMPSVGLGTYRVRDEAELPKILQCALDSGYRLIDTAQVYRNEAAIGNFLHKKFTDPSCSLVREDIFITSKLAPANQGYDACYKSICDSLSALKVDYIDLFLIHWPGTQGVKRDDSATNAKNRAESWRAMEQAYRENKPALNQVELHPFYPQNELHQLCSKSNVLIQAYSSFGEGSLLNPSSVHHQTLVQRIMQKVPDFNSQHLPHHLLHWALARNISVIPKSTTPGRIASNFEVFNVPVDKKVL
ncbi:hypothetical protein DSO57_1033878 [Entomophthora muscae]|uniref:Uncharacterized protein n=1 Tax=Entomophthora muscae TaxID=34485 RepID=A0ACC2RER6_9FUNG|nr:hypothetical protein DSO57_1033878 [Entomophthora muscae]